MTLRKPLQRAIIAAVMAGLILLAAAVVWHAVRVPFWLARLKGSTPDEVIRRIGAPTMRWSSPAEFNCYDGWTCDKQKAKGPVLLFPGFGTVYYAFFDGNDRLYAFDASGS